jgi:hypothetical protein
MTKYDMGFSPGRGYESKPQRYGFPMYIAVEGPASPSAYRSRNNNNNKY